jgi:hypothetical protein
MSLSQGGHIECLCNIDMTTGSTDSYIDSQYMFPPCDIDMTTGTTG